jgi:hypothetical protein
MRWNYPQTIKLSEETKNEWIEEFMELNEKNMKKLPLKLDKFWIEVLINKKLQENQQ